MRKIIKATLAIATVATLWSVSYATPPNVVVSEKSLFDDDINTVQVDIVNVQAVSAGQVTFDLDVVESENIDFSGSLITADYIDVMMTEDVTADIPQYAAMLAEQQSLLRDQRNIRHDPALNSLASENWIAWKKIYNDPEYKNYTMEYKPLLANLRIINEVWGANDSTQLRTMLRRLKEYRRWGYNAVLVCFDTSENLLDLMCTIDYIRSTGMKIVIVYTGGKETLHDSVFRDPVILRKFLMALAPKADALLLGWWRTSIHLFIPDKSYTNYIIKSARSANPDLPVIGQAYWGQTAETGTDHKNFKVTVDLPTNASAVLIMGIGFPGLANKQTLDFLFKDVSTHPHKIALVAGEKPYYDTHNNTGRSELENRKIKRALENRLLRSGFQSTMTFSGDGSNGMYKKNKTENICLEYAK